MRFVKMNGAGNAFAVFDARDAGGLDLSADQARAIAQAAQADQIIVIEPARDGEAQARLRFWNSDGGEVGACGNGTRAAAWLLLEDLSADDVAMQTEAGTLRAARAGDLRVAVDMGEPRLEWEQIPLAERMDTRGVDLKVGPIDNPALRFPGAVNMGNPHIVFFVDHADAAPVREVGSLVEQHPLFPEGVNVGFAEVRGRGEIRLKVWERGAGLTQACGTGACAAVVAAYRRRLSDRSAEVIADGGRLHVDWRKADNHVILTGPVEIEGEGEFTL